MRRGGWDVVGVGANSVDYVYRLPGSVGFGQGRDKVRVRERHVWYGGQTATALATCASFGLRAAYVGTVGADAAGREILAELARRGIDVSAARVRQTANPYAVILVDDTNGERVVLWDRPPGLELRPGEIDAELVASARLVHVDDVEPAAAIAAAAIARGAGLPVTSDIDTASDRVEELVSAVSIPIFAAHVPGAITGEADVERALRKLRRRHAGWLCVTLGREGAILLEGDRLHRCPAVEVQAVDTTGAGDVFRGAFIYAYLSGRPPADILRWANLAAALSCTRHGAMNSVPEPAEVSRRFENAAGAAG